MYPILLVLMWQEDRILPCPPPLLCKMVRGWSQLKGLIRVANWLCEMRGCGFNSESIIRHYDVDIKPEVPSKHGRPVKISKACLAMIRDKFFASNPSEFPLSMTAYDGEKNIFSAVPLPAGTYKVEFAEAEDVKARNYIFTIKLVNELKFSKLKDYLSGNPSSIPRDILQGMDVVMKEHPSRHMISVGRSFHFITGFRHDDLRYGIIASKGSQHSLKPTNQGLSMCLDYSVLSFYKPLSVLDFLKEHIPGFSVHEFRSFRRDVERVLKGLKVLVTHRVTKQKYIIGGLTRDDTRHLSFDLDDPDGNAPPRRVSLLDYFRQKYQKDIMYKDIPCLDVGKNNRQNFVPMEFCILMEGQIYPKESLGRDAAQHLKEISLAKPKVRQDTICGMVRARDGPCGGEIIGNFGMEIDTNMTSVVARVIGPPQLKIGGPNGRPFKVTVDKEKCHWNLVGKMVAQGKLIDRWAVIDFSASDRVRLNENQFIRKLIGRCNSLGMPMEEPLFYEASNMRILSNVDRLCELLEGANDKAYRKGKGQLQFLLCVMSRKDPGYKNLKWLAETRVGLITQCCLSGSANKLQDQYLANLALKINAKLGGSNVELNDQLPNLNGEDHVMFIGADVNHPGARNRTSPSIAAVVGSLNWPAANRYASRVCSQDHRTEKILNFGDMCSELVDSYARLNRVKPRKIVIFRDGVSEGQFDMVLNEELMDFKRAVYSNSYTPTVTLIVAQKRHQTRLFPESERDGASNGNISPGTVVDTKIVHPYEYDFYLCSHYGSLGTSKPTHYHVLWDEHGFTSDQLQQMIYNMCFTFVRCTKPVSLVPPVFYADIAAYRGRIYHEAVMEGQSPASTTSSSSSRTSSTLSFAASLDDNRFCKLHANLENNMFFV
ncbi:hypothetical protein Tsubulata_025857 [Turnera subulata]|uniref:Piwi domain-containing protein n=1 Tax=Turnera subulata TaxID=218843 RepID=A0A9Q0FAW3_9ROSI|nr:hypothetical protein Tsubulata_025857 [Turnera subulata]